MTTTCQNCGMTFLFNTQHICPNVFTSGNSYSNLFNSQGIKTDRDLLLDILSKLQHLENLIEQKGKI
jgi:hypothetical protein